MQKVMEFYDRLKQELGYIVERHNLFKECVTITARALTPKEAIGEPERREFPLLIGRKTMKRMGSKLLIYLVMLSFIILNISASTNAEELMVFSGAAFKKPLDDLIQGYDKARVSANKEAYAFLGAERPVGGAPVVSQEWIKR
jgi:hypothetical protein